MYCYHVNVSSLCFGVDEKGIEPIHFTSEVDVITVRELITRTVKKQLDALQKEHSIATKRIKASLERQYLSDEEIALMAKKGSVYLEEQNKGIEAKKVKNEVSRALIAFREKKFFITIKGDQPEQLDDNVALMKNTEVLFLRLMPLIGG